MERKWYGRDTQLSVRMFITMFLLVLLYLAFLFALYQAGADFITMAAIAGVVIFAQYFFSEKLILLSTGARMMGPNEAPELHAMVDRLAALADLPKPGLAILETSVPNAFAAGRSPKTAFIAVTTGLLQELNGPELEAVIAHELAHVKNRDVIVMTIASFLSTVAFMVVRFAMWGGVGFGGRGRDRNDSASWGVIAYLVAIVVWFLSMLLLRALSRYREFAADRGSAIITGSPSQLTSALLKISGRMQRIPQRDLREVQGANAFFIIPAVSGKSFLELFSTHPSLEKRLEKLRQLEREIEGTRVGG